MYVEILISTAIIVSVELVVFTKILEKIINEKKEIIILLFIFIYYFFMQ